MTALTDFQRLESQGSWRATPDGDPRAVVVSLGEATLTLMDPATDKPLAHWSLPAVVRIDPDSLPAIYTPSEIERDETVEIDDPLMIEAIARVQRAIAHHRAHPGRLRSILLVLAAMAMVLGVGLWLPDALIRHAASIAPPAQARDLGLAVLQDMSKTGGAICRRNSGQQVLDWLVPRLLGPEAKAHVIPGPLNGARRLPGDLYVMGADLLTASTGPEAAAGHLLAAEQALDPAEVKLDTLRHAGLIASLQMMTLGSVPAASVEGMGAGILVEPLPRPDLAALPPIFAEKGVPTEPYARSLDPTGSSVMPLIEAGTGDTSDLLTPEQWQALQQICAG